MYVYSTQILPPNKSPQKALKYSKTLIITIVPITVISYYVRTQTKYSV